MCNITLCSMQLLIPAYSVKVVLKTVKMQQFTSRALNTGQKFATFAENFVGNTFFVFVNVQSVIDFISRKFDIL